MGSEPLSAPSVTKDNMADLPGYCALTFTLMPVGSTSRRSVQVLGFTSMGPLTPPCRLYPLPVRQASALPAASSRFRLATGTLAVQLTLPLAGCVEDLHLQVSAPCRAHPKRRGEPSAPLQSNLPLLRTVRGARIQVDAVRNRCPDRSRHPHRRWNRPTRCCRPGYPR